MPTNKHAIIRYNVIDRCLKNTGRLWSFKDLKEAVEEKLCEIDSSSSGISIKSLRNDIAFMRSPEGYDAPIVSFKQAKKHFYKYEDSTFSINKRPLSENDANKLQSALSVLQRFEGSQEFEWIEDISLILKDHFGFNSDNRKIIGHDNDINISYKGYNYITPIFNAISNQRVLEVEYISFQGEKYTFEYHPYYLKQFNKRWFVFGLHSSEKNPYWNIPLDRIYSMKEIGIPYIKDRTDWEFYFSDIIGVTKPINTELQEIRLRFDAKQAPYITTKPIHESQKQPKYNKDDTVDIIIQVIPNYELISKILSYGDSVTVIAPLTLRETIVNKIKALYINYEL